jgi:deoxyxylulose-5-phosphate synthase
MTDQEMTLQRHLRSVREEDFTNFINMLSEKEDGDKVKEQLLVAAKSMNLGIIVSNNQISGVKQIEVSVKTRKAAVREKRIEYNVEQLPKFEKNKEYRSNDVITGAMKVFAKDQRVVSLDADLAAISGLQAGVCYVDTDRALNVGIAESNMMGIAEGYAAMGFNTWLSTFCPFFDCRVLRRIAIGYQERLETINRRNGWLNNGHGLDITFLATAPNFDTTINGATHMGNDDMHIFGGISHLKIIDSSCPSQLLAIMKWIMDGDKGLVYLRIMRAASKIIYDNGFQFEF